MSSDSVDSGSSTPKPITENRDLRVVLEIERGGPCYVDESLS